ncbi:MAG TPA: T9SS type A sorting domain-containing protein, partial [Bacteroidia bacterium]|nr:T9SS type A sorting domain-containing protein [Bacteroidia bacterium]
VTAPTWIGSNSFQIILNKNDSSITFQYWVQTGVYINGGNFMTVGIENNTGNVGLQVMYNPPNLGGYYIATPYAVKFYYPPSTTYVVNDVEAHWSNNLISGGVFLSRATPIPFQMTAAVKNTGNVSVSPFGVNCKILNSSNVIMTQDNAVSNALSPAQVQVLTMNNTFSTTATTPLGTYKMITTTSLAGDIVASNNVGIHEIVVVDTVPANIRLSFDDNGADGAGLSWGGGDGGAGMQFVPPFYPCRVKQLHFFIESNDSSYGFYAMVNASGGPNGLPGQLLDSVYIPPTSVTAGAWNDVLLSIPLQIDTGSFYLSWHMGGNNITLGRDTAKPISNRTFEVLGNTWAIYRYRETEDLMINATIERDPNVAVTEIVPTSAGAGDFYPNPASKNTMLELNVNTQDVVLVSLFSVDGKRVYENKIPSGHSSRLLIPLDVSKLENGIYMCRIRAGDFEATRKITVAH